MRATLMSRLRSGLANPHPDLPERENPDDIEAERIGEQIAAALVARANAPPQQPAPEPRERPAKKENADEYVFPDELARPPGLLGEIADWVYATSMQPQRVAAL